MAQPPAADAPPVDRDVWITCAAPGSCLPAVGSQVYYFPHGHAEQCPAPLPAPLSEPHFFPCTVHGVELFADAITDEPYATITLTPRPQRDHPENANPTPDTQKDPDFCHRVKELMNSDTNNIVGLSVPDTCAEIFPTVDLQGDQAVQSLHMRDLCGNLWNFRHVYCAIRRCHIFTTGWTKFVDKKLPVAGDTVVFIRRPNGDLVVGLRRVPMYPMSQNADEPPRNARARVQPQEVMDSVRDAANGDRFTVTYYPRQGAGEFVVPRKEVENALNGAWLPGVHVSIQGEAIDAKESRFKMINGVVKAVDSHIWRMLEVEWDVSESPTKINRHVNPWQIQLVMAEPSMGPESQNIPAVTQETRRTVLADVPSSSSITELDQFPQAQGLPILPSSSVDSSEVVNPEPTQCDTNASSVPNKDASATSPHGCCMQ